jgi:hypothetical protein
MTETTEPVDDSVSAEECLQAEDNWYQAHYGIRCEETMERFFKYCHSLEQSRVDDQLLAEDPSIKRVASSTANRIRLLASPHFKTVVNAYYAKYPWKIR